MDVAAILNRKFPGVTGWTVVNNQITKFPKDLTQPDEKELAAWWDEIEIELDRERIALEREQKYKQETDALLFDALAQLDIPELKEWQDAREAVKQELPYPDANLEIRR